MDKIGNLITAVLMDVAKKYVKAKEEECHNENEQFKEKVISAVKGYCRNFFIFSLVVALTITGFLFLRDQADGK